MDSGFSSYLYCNVDLSTFKPEDYFSEYHYFEPFDENKTYEKKQFFTKYGDNYESNYIYILYNFNETLKYVAAKEILSEEQIKDLAKFCQCLYHKMSWYNPKRLFVCQCCVGCLNSPFPQQSIINEARKYKIKSQSIY